MCKSLCVEVFIVMRGYSNYGSTVMYNHATDITGYDTVFFYRTFASSSKLINRIGLRPADAENLFTLRCTGVVRPARSRRPGDA